MSCRLPFSTVVWCMRTTFFGRRRLGAGRAARAAWTMSSARPCGDDAVCRTWKRAGGKARRSYPLEGRLSATAGRSPTEGARRRADGEDDEEEERTAADIGEEGRGWWWWAGRTAGKAGAREEESAGAAEGGRRSGAGRSLPAWRPGRLSREAGVCRAGRALLYLYSSLKQ